MQGVRPLPPRQGAPPPPRKLPSLHSRCRCRVR
nr:MAG TPA: hypothetical protein [Caudoviricetes sp.]